MPINTVPPRSRRPDPPPHPPRIQRRAVIPFPQRSAPEPIGDPELDRWIDERAEKLDGVATRRRASLLDVVVLGLWGAAIAAGFAFLAAQYFGWSQ